MTMHIKLDSLEAIRAALESRELGEVNSHPINYPFYLTLKGKSFTIWFKVTGVNKSNNYTGFQITQEADQKKPGKAVAKTIPNAAKEDYKHVPAHEVPEDIMKKFNDKPDGGKKIGGDEGAKVTVKADKADKKEGIERIRAQVEGILGAWPMLEYKPNITMKQPNLSNSDKAKWRWDSPLVWYDRIGAYNAANPAKAGGTVYSAAYDAEGGAASYHVAQVKGGEKWDAWMSANHGQKKLGVFSSRDDAMAAVEKEHQRLGREAYQDATENGETFFNPFGYKDPSYNKWAKKESTETIGSLVDQLKTLGY